MNGALTQPFSICTADVILLSGTGTGVLWPCSKPLGALLSRGTLVYDTSLHNAPSHCLAQFLVQVTSHPHPGFGLSLRVEVLPSSQDSTPLDVQSKHNFLYPHSWGMLLFKTHKALLSFSSFHKSSSTKIPRKHSLGPR